MTDLQDDTTPESERHRKTAAALYNHTWDLIEKAGRSVDEDEEMLHAAHASAYHWLQVSDRHKEVPERSHWQLARVYTLLRRPTSALYHAHQCLRICEQLEIGDLDLAFAHEAVARAAALASDEPLYARHLAVAREAGERIGGSRDREIFFRELETGPWFAIDHADL
jgi:hypothetical protein